jgi:integrase
MSDDLWTICTDYFFPRKLECRAQKTRYGYRLAIDHFGRHLGRQPVTLDLNDDTVIVWVSSQLDEAKSVYTVRERTGRILTLWRFLAARRIVECWPTIRRPPAPDPLPIALSEEQLAMLFDACLYEPGRIAGIRAGWWWQAFLAFVFTTSERRSAALALRWEWIDFGRATVVIPPAVRKGGRKAGIYPLYPEVALLLERIRMPPRELVFPWDASLGAYFYRYGRILERAGLPNDRKHKTHSLRVTHNTLVKILTDAPSPLLGHSSSETSERHYEDRRMTAKPPARLPTPWA